MTATLETLAPRIVVLCGPLRAGTTLLRLLLGRHPDLTGRGESDYLFELATPESLRTGGTDAQRAALRDYIASHRIPKAQNVTPPEPAPLGEMIAAMIAEAMPQEGKLLLTLHRHADVAAAALPGAAFVKLHRDPKDVAISSMKMGWAANPYYGVDVWRAAERDWNAALPLIEGPRTAVAFEALTENPEGELRRVLSDVGLPFDPAVLAPDADSTYSAPTPGRNHAWRGALSEREAGEIDWRIRNIPDDGRYPRTPIEPGAARKAKLYGQNKVGRHVFAAKRYGAGLHFGAVVARRLRLPIYAKLRRRVDEITISHLK